MNRLGLSLIALAILVSVGYAVLPKGKTIPNFQSLLLDRKILIVSTSKGKLTVSIKEDRSTKTIQPKVLIIKFWATWSDECRIASRWLTKLHQRYSKKGLVIIGVSIDEDGRKSVVPFVKDEKTPYLIALDPRAEVANPFKVEVLPTIYIVDSKGVIQAVFEDAFKDTSEMERILRRLKIK